MNRSANASGVYTHVEELLKLRHLSKDLTLDTRKKSAAILDGEAKTHFRGGRGMDFAEVRPYQAGDDVRNIDWRVTARTQKPYTKLFQEERERPIFLLVDQRASMFFGSRGQFKSVLAAKLAAVIGWTALANNDRIGALVFSDNDQTDARARRGKHAQLNLLHNLQQYNERLTHPFVPHTENTIGFMLRELRRVAKPGSSVFIMSDFHDYGESCQEPLALLARHTDVTLLKISDPLEEQLPLGKNLVVSNGEMKTSLANASNQFAKDFQLSFNDITAQIRLHANQLGLKLASINTRSPLEQTLRDLFVAKSKRKAAKNSNGDRL